MKKKILSIALMGALTGFTGVHAAEPAELFQQDITKVQKQIIDPYGMNTVMIDVEFSKVNVEGNKLTYEMMTKLFDKVEEYRLIEGAGVNILEKNEVKLSGYKANKGKAKISGEFTPSIVIKPHKKEIVTLLTVTTPGTYTATLNNAKKTYESKEDLVAQDIMVSYEDAAVGVLALGHVKAVSNFVFDDNYSAVRSLDQEINLGNSNFVAAEDAFKISVGQTDYRLKGDMAKKIHENAVNIKDFVFELKNEIKIELPKIFTSIALNPQGKKHITFDYSSETHGLTLTNIKDNGGVGEFGDFKLGMNVNGLDTEKSAELFSFIVELQRNIQKGEIFDEEEVGLRVLNLFGETMSDKSEFVMNFVNKASNDQEFLFSFNVKPTKALLNAFKNPEEEASKVYQLSQEEMLERYLSELNFHITVPDSYISNQYVNSSTFIDANADVAKAKKEVGQAIQMSQMTLAMVTPENMTLVQRDDKKNTSTVDIKYKDSKWNINGSTFTTKEITDLINSLPF